MAKIKTLKDYNNETIYPQSVTQAILDAEGNNLDAIHGKFIISSEIENVESLDVEHEITSNKTVNIDNTSTNIQYPSAKAVYDFVLANKDIGINMEVVDSLPTENIDSKTIYLVKTNTESIYDIYIYANGEWRQVGNTEVNLNNYFQKTGDTVTGNITMTSGTNIINSVSNAQIQFLANGDIRIDAPLASGGSAAITVGADGINLVNGSTAVIQTTETNINIQANTDITGHSLTGLPEPINSTDAVTKEYVDFQKDKIEKKLDQAEAILPTQVASGEYVYIDNAVNYQLMGLSGEGKCEQKTTEGYNLYNVKGIKNMPNGVTVDENGWITATFDNSTGESTKYLQIYTDNLNIKTATRYAIVTEIKSITGNGVLFSNTMYNNGTIISGQFTSSTSYAFNTLSNNVIKVSVKETNDNFENIANDGLRTLVVFGASESGSITFRISVLEDSTITANTFKYESYTGGQPSPNPDYSQKIKTITEAEYKGITDNLYNYKDTIKVGNNVTVDDDGWITATCDNTSGTASKYLNYFTNNLTLETNKQYTVVLEVKAVSGTGLIFPYSKFTSAGQFNSEYNVSFSDLSNNSIKILNPWTKESFENVIQGLRTFVEFKAGKSGSITFRISVLQDTDIIAESFVYKPYQENTLLIDLQGNELCELDKLLIDRKGNIAINKDTGKIIFNGTENFAIVDNRIGCSSKSIPQLSEVYIEVPNTNKNLTPLLCNYYTGGTQASVVAGSNKIGFSKWDYITYLYFPKDYETVEEFKARVTTHNIEIYYRLAIPQIINLGKIENPEIFKGVNNITIKTNLGNMNIEVEYVEDLQARISKIEQAIVALGGI